MLELLTCGPSPPLLLDQAGTMHISWARDHEQKLVADLPLANVRSLQLLPISGRSATGQLC